MLFWYYYIKIACRHSFRFSGHIKHGGRRVFVRMVWSRVGSPSVRQWTFEILDKVLANSQIVVVLRWKTCYNWNKPDGIISRNEILSYFDVWKRFNSNWIEIGYEQILYDGFNIKFIITLNKHELSTCIIICLSVNTSEKITYVFYTISVIYTDRNGKNFCFHSCRKCFTSTAI